MFRLSEAKSRWVMSVSEYPIREKKVFILITPAITHKLAIAAARSIFEERVILDDLLYFLLRKIIDYDNGFRRPTKLLSTGLSPYHQSYISTQNFNKNLYEKETDNYYKTS